jgi:membrane-bound lytic murein transglycosylase A
MDTPDTCSPAQAADRLSYAPVTFGQLAGWEADDHRAAFDAFCRSAARMVKHPYLTQSGMVDSARLQRCVEMALMAGDLDGAAAKRFFEDNFTPHDRGASDRFDGFLTGYYEPELEASRTPGPDFTIPLYRAPQDLADWKDHNKPYRLDRGSIQAGALAEQGLELVWLKDKTDTYFVHVQGAARLLLQDGEVMRVGFAGKTGHSYTSLGKVLCKQLDIAPADMTADRLANWMRDHPDEIDGFMALNQSYIFFQEAEYLDASDGPVGAAEIPLIAGRSLAVDRTIHPYGVPIWLSTPYPLSDGDDCPGRLMVAHDTGSAIKGPERGDLFVGSGRSAGLVAGRMQCPARMTILVPRP